MRNRVTDGGGVRAEIGAVLSRAFRGDRIERGEITMREVVIGVFGTDHTADLSRARATGAWHCAPCLTPSLSLRPYHLLTSQLSSSMETWLSPFSRWFSVDQTQSPVVTVPDRSTPQQGETDPQSIQDEQEHTPEQRPVQETAKHERQDQEHPIQLTSEQQEAVDYDSQRIHTNPAEETKVRYLQQ